MTEPLRGKIFSIILLAGLTAIGGVSQTAGPFQFDAATIRINNEPGMGIGRRVRFNRKRTDVNRQYSSANADQTGIFGNSRQASHHRPRCARHGTC